MESAAISARREPETDRPLRATEELIDGIFSSLVVMEDTLLGGRQILKSLSDPISRIDSQGPIYPPDIQAADDAASGVRSEPSLVEKLKRIHVRIEELRDLARGNNEIAGSAVNRLDAAV